MIPEKLSMHNFMSYQDNVPSLYFDGIHTHAVVAAMAIAIGNQAQPGIDNLTELTLL
jgi:hypothetical protein